MRSVCSFATIIPCVSAVLLIARGGDAFIGKFSFTSIKSTMPMKRRMAFDVADEMTTEQKENQSFSSASSYYSGAGVAQVDMNDYNLPIDEIANEWTAELIPESSLREEGVYLGAKSSKEIMVDQVKVSVPRKVGEGLGIELLEIAGGRADGLGITVVNGLVEGGCADGLDINVGDSISQIEVRKTQKRRQQDSVLDGKDRVLSEVEDIDSVFVECFGYDKTVEAIGSLPPAESDDEIVVLTLKRLRRRPKVTLNLQYPPYQQEPDTSIELFAGENLRRAMLTRGVKLNDPLSRRFDSGGIGDCGAEGTCATCVVNIIDGKDLLNPAGTQEAQILVKNPRWRMACKAVVGYGMREGEMTIQVNPRQWTE